HVFAEEIEIVGHITAERLVEKFLSAVAEEKVVHHLDRRDAFGCREPRDAFAAIGLVVRNVAEREDAPQEFLDRVTHRADRALLRKKLFARLGIAERPNLLRQRQMRELAPPGRMSDEDVEVRLKAVKDTRRSPRNLRADVHAIAPGLL